MRKQSLINSSRRHRSRTCAPPCQPRDSEGFCPHRTSKPRHLGRAQTQAWSLQSAQQLLTRTVDRDAALCPGEQRGTQLQLALGTVSPTEPQNHSSGRNPEEGRGGPRGRAQVSGRHCFLQSPGLGALLFLCVTDAFGNLTASMDLLLETKTHVRSFAHGIGGFRDPPPLSNVWNLMAQ